MKLEDQSEKKNKPKPTTQKMKLTPQQEKLLTSKLRRPVHVNYIAHLLRCEVIDAEKLMLDWEEQGIVEEYNPNISKKYYSLKNNIKQ